MRKNALAAGGPAGGAYSALPSWIWGREEWRRGMEMAIGVKGNGRE